jgi:hypothetical protein
MAGSSKRKRRQDRWPCGLCTYINNADAEKCSMCDNTRDPTTNLSHTPPPPPPPSTASSSHYNCSACTYKNDLTNESCEMCETENPFAVQNTIQRSIVQAQPNPTAEKWKDGVIVPSSISVLRDVMKARPSLIIASSFQTDIEWLVKHVIPPSVSRMIYILHAPATAKDVAPHPRQTRGNSMFCFPELRGGYGFVF